MGATAEKLDYLAQTKAFIAAAIEAQGVTISDEDTFRSYVEKILTIGKLPVITEADEGKILKIINGAWAIGDGVKTDDTLTLAGGAADAKATGDRFALIEKDVADLLYDAIGAISVTSFATSVATAEIGSTVNDVKLSWKLNRKPVSVAIDGAAQDAVAEGSLSLTGLGLTESKSWTIRATDERDAVATKSTSLSFVNGVYYGAAAEPATIDSAFVRSLTRTLRSSKLTSFTANVTSGKYLWYCLPVRYGTCTFSLGVLPGGVGLVDTIELTNASGYTESYYVYRSDYAGIGNKTVTVK